MKDADMQIMIVIFMIFYFFTLIMGFRYALKNNKRSMRAWLLAGGASVVILVTSIVVYTYYY